MVGVRLDLQGVRHCSEPPTRLVESLEDLDLSAALSREATHDVVVAVLLKPTDAYGMNARSRSGSPAFPSFCTLEWVYRGGNSTVSSTECPSSATVAATNVAAPLYSGVAMLMV